MRHVFTLLAMGIVGLTAATNEILAAPFVLTFNALKHDEPVANYYEGGYGGMGTGPGPNLGVTFPSHALAFGPLGPVPGPILYWDDHSKSNITINVPGGFDTGFSFLFTSDVAGAVWIYDGPDATGNQLAKLTLPDQNFDETNFELFPISLSFDGTARSVRLGSDSHLVIFDDLTFGSLMPGVPEPTTLSLIVPGVVATTLSRRFRRPQVG